MIFPHFYYFQFFPYFDCKWYYYTFSLILSRLENTLNSHNKYVFSQNKDLDKTKNGTLFSSHFYISLYTSKSAPYNLTTCRNDYKRLWIQLFNLCTKFHCFYTLTYSMNHRLLLFCIFAHNRRNRHPMS